MQWINFGVLPRLLLQFAHLAAGESALFELNGPFAIRRHRRHRRRRRRLSVFYKSRAWLNRCDCGVFALHWHIICHAMPFYTKQNTSHTEWSQRPHHRKPNSTQNEKKTVFWVTNKCVYTFHVDRPLATLRIFSIQEFRQNAQQRPILCNSVLFSLYVLVSSFCWLASLRCAFSRSFVYFFSFSFLFRFFFFAMYRRE